MRYASSCFSFCFTLRYIIYAIKAMGRVRHWHPAMLPVRGQSVNMFFQSATAKRCMHCIRFILENPYFFVCGILVMYLGRDLCSTPKHPIILVAVILWFLAGMLLCLDLGPFGRPRLQVVHLLLSWHTALLTPPNWNPLINPFVEFMAFITRAVTPHGGPGVFLCLIFTLPVLCILMWCMDSPRELAMLEGTYTPRGKCICTNGNAHTAPPVRVVFRKKIGEYVDAQEAVSLSGKFFGWKSQIFLVFAFVDDTRTVAFSDDFDRPHSLIRIMCNLGVRIGIILLPRSMYMYSFSFLHVGSVFCALIAAYSLWLYLIQICRQHEIYSKELAMLDQAGVARWTFEQK